MEEDARGAGGDAGCATSLSIAREWDYLGKLYMSNSGRLDERAKSPSQ